MKILMTADTVGGVWTYALDLCEALAAAGASTTLVTMGRKMAADQRAAAEAVAGLEVIETEYRLEWMQEPWKDVARAGKVLLEVAAQVQPDVVHLNGYVHASLDWDVVRAPVIVVGHSCVETWFRAVRGERPPRCDWAQYTQRVQQGIHEADAFVAPTHAMLEAYTQVYGRHRRGLVIHNGRQQRLYRPGKKEPVVLSAGRLWDEAKNVAALAEAAQWVAWPVKVAGEEASPDGGARADVAATCLGQLSAAELADEMSRASIYALPARYEPFGLSPVEAALSGCALVLGDIPTLREVWGDDAVFVNPDMPRRLASVINELIDDESRRLALADRSRRRALEFSSQRMAGRYLALYRQLLSQPKRQLAHALKEVSACAS